MIELGASQMDYNLISPNKKAKLESVFIIIKRELEAQSAKIKMMRVHNSSRQRFKLNQNDAYNAIKFFMGTIFD